MNARIVLIGAPGPIGGACTEAWHAVKLWRRFGCDVTCIPTWKIDGRFVQLLTEIGCRVQQTTPGKCRVPDGSIVVSFCNMPFFDLAKAGAFRSCRTVWVPCMNYRSDREVRYHNAGLRFDAYVHQSEYQARVLKPATTKHGIDETCWHHIPGWLDVDEFPFTPRRHRHREPFVIGRLSRPDPRKFSPDTWSIYRGIPNVRARVMGWTPNVARRLGGGVPSWAECLEKGAESTREFLASLHAIVHVGGEAVENWPRFALEAMAAGVPVVTDASGGVPEMIASGVSGILCSSPADFTAAACRLAEDERARLGMADLARRTVETVLCEPETAWNRWQTLFDSLR